MSKVLNEVEAAARAGFARHRHFVDARRKGLFPSPVKELPGVGPVWTDRQLDEWLGETSKPEQLRQDQRDAALERLDK